jgi:methylenetetrahydrofolate dehydrogenase (NADP+) / methenyltetrahydrofolate cyclohydrolase
MTRAQIIDGKAIAAQVREGVRERAVALRERGIEPRLDAVLAAGEGDDAARVYAENQARTCKTLGIAYKLHLLPPGATFDEIAGRVLLLSNDDAVRAIMVHLPLPAGVDTPRVQALIAPEKDVEGVNPANIGNIVYGRSSLAPCTASAVVRMIESVGMELKGKRAVCIGASNIVGKPIAVMLMRPEATVISCNKHTQGIAELARSADILVAAAGVAGLVERDWVKPGAVVIDVGIHRLAEPSGKRKTVGDVDFKAVREVAGHLSPVPGGVGPVTVAMLLENVVAACERAG